MPGVHHFLHHALNVHDVQRPACMLPSSGAPCPGYLCPQVRVGDVRLMLPCGESAPPDMLLNTRLGATATALTDLDPEEITTSLLDVYAQRTPMCVLTLGSFQATTINAQLPTRDGLESPRVTVDSEMGELLQLLHGRGVCMAESHCAGRQGSHVGNIQVATCPGVAVQHLEAWRRGGAAAGGPSVMSCVHKLLTLQQAPVAAV